MPIGGGKELVLIDWPMTASNDTGNPVLNKMGGRCQFTRTTDTSTKKFEQHGCTYADSDGDQIFEQCDAALGAPTKCKLIGGTGKFNGIQAEMDITAAPLKDTYDGVSQIMGQTKETHKIVKTN